MSEKGTIILKKKGGLGKLRKLIGTPKEYYQDREDRDSDGQYAGEYREPSLPKARHYINPIFDELKGKWSWGGTQEELAWCIQNLKLRFESGKMKDEIIQVSDVDSTNIADPFFNHSFLYSNRYLEGGRIMLNRDVPLDELLHLVYKGLREVHDKTQNRSSTFVAGAKYELVNPKIAKAKRARNVREEMKATRMLDEMSFEKQTLIAQILDLPGYDRNNEDPENILLMLKDQAIENEETVSRFNGRTWRERFIELSLLDQGDLYVMSQVIRGKKLRILNPRGSYYQFNTGNSGLPDRLDGITTDVQLINFFRNDDNQEYYLELVNQLDQRVSKNNK